MSFGFPGEDSIRARAIDEYMKSQDEPESHHPRCPCNGMTPEDREENPNCECICYELEAEDAEDAAVEDRLRAMEDRDY